MLQGRRLRELSHYYCAVSPYGLEQSSDGSGTPTGKQNADTFRPRQPVLASDPVLTTLAQTIALRLDCQRCLISLIDDEYQYVIAEATRSISPYNIDDHDKDDDIMLGAQSLPVNWGVCSSVLSAFVDGTEIDLKDKRNIASRDAVVISDLVQEGKTCFIPVVRGNASRLRYYIGVPLRTDSGHCIGVICLFDPQARNARQKEASIAEQYAKIVAQYLFSMRVRDEHKHAKRLLTGMSRFLEGKSDIAEQIEDGPNESSEPISHDSTIYSLSKSEKHHSTTNSSPEQLTPEPSDSATPTVFFQGKPNQVAPDIDHCQSIPHISTADSGRCVDGSIPRSSDHSSNQALTAGPLSALESIFSRGSSLIRESLELDGAIFLEVPPNDRYNSTFYKTTNLSNEQDQTSDTDISLDNDHTSSSDDSEEQFTHFLGMSQKAQPSAMDVMHPQVPVRLLSQMTSRYPKGCVLYMGIDGFISSEDETSRKDSQAISGNKKKFLNKINQAFKDVQSLVFVPLLNHEDEQLYAGFFGWSVSPLRALAKSDLLYVSSFTHSMMNEVLRLQNSVNDHIKSNFISSISHELRSPLHGILLANQLLAETTPTPEQLEHVTMTEICARTLLDVMENLLHHSKINAVVKGTKTLSGLGRRNHTMKPISYSLREEVDMLSLIEDTAATVVVGDRYAMHKQHIHNVKQHTEQFMMVPVSLDLRSVDGWSFKTEPGSWRRIIMNLLGNAIKYTSSGCILVRLFIRRYTKNSAFTHMAELRVKDTGCGISQTFLKHRLFTPYAQENNLSVGTGLGLSLVKQMVSLLGGTLRVDSKIGHGTEAVAKIPLEAVSFNTAQITIPDASKLSIEALGYQGFYIDAGASDSSAPTSASITSQQIAQSVSSCLVNWFKLQLCSWEDARILVVHSDILLADPGRYDIEGKTILIIGNEQALKNNTPINLKRAKSVSLKSPIGPRSITLAFQQLFKSSNYVGSAAMPDMTDRRNGKASHVTSSIDKLQLVSQITTRSVERANAILLVDDNSINLRLLLAAVTKLNEGLDHRYITATNGEQALKEYIKATNAGTIVTAVFMDISMPVMDGLQATRAIRAFESSNMSISNSRTKIIALTGLASTEAQAQIVESGADMYLCKPASVSSIRTVLNTIVLGHG